MHLIVWEFEVVAGAEAAFEDVYGPRGEWVRLFRRAPGYLWTDLSRHVGDRRKYVVVDYWSSRDSYIQFIADDAGEEYRALDRRCESLTTRERYVGEFELVDAPSGHARRTAIAPAGDRATTNTTLGEWIESVLTRDEFAP